MSTRYSLGALAHRSGHKRPKATLPTIASRSADREALRRIIVSVVDGGAEGRERLLRLANAAQAGITQDDIGLDGGMRDFRASQQSRLGQATLAIRGWVNRVAARFDLRWVQAVKAALGVDIAPLVHAGDLQAVLGLVTQKLTTHISGLASDVANRIEAGLIDLITKGASTKAKAAVMVEAVAKARKAAEQTAKRETETFHAVLNQFRQTQAGVTEYVWWTREDERVRGNPAGRYPTARPSHYKRHGRTFRWDQPPNEGRHDGHPGEPINCFKGSAEVDLSNGCHKLWRRFYSGPFVTVEAGHGRLLEATPNHPVLTGRGWLAINDLQEGDYLVQRSQRSRIAQADDGDLVTSFDDLFVALSASNGTEAARGSVLDFHGDGSEGQVDVISPDRGLLARAKAGLDQALKDFLLARALGDVGPRFNLDGSLYTEACRMLDAPDSRVRGLRQLRALLRCEPSHSDVVGGGPIPQRHTSGSQNAIYHDPLDAEASRKAQDAFARAVARYDLIVRKVVPAVVRTTSLPIIAPETLSRERFAEIVGMAAQQSGDIGHGLPAGYEFSRVRKKSISEFSGHVYNLETSTGWYSSDGFVASNCRCVARPVINITPSKEPLDRKRARSAGLRAVASEFGLSL